MENKVRSEDFSPQHLRTKVLTTNKFYCCRSSDRAAGDRTAIREWLGSKCDRPFYLG
ncbi:MAG: hypothetical protein ACRCZS_06840 [Chroococcidiopsis sp.]